MNIIEKYFPNLSSEQHAQFSSLYELYNEWNAKINVISRKDIDNIYLHHILHSLSIAKYIQFAKGSKIMDIGTGGGFPGIPLAIMFPDSQFMLIDSIGKKIRVAQEVAQAIGLKNVDFKHSRVEEEKGKYDFVVSRAVMPLPDLVKVIKKNIAKEDKNAMSNGLICLKGGNLQEELKPFSKIVDEYPLSNFFEEEVFETKSIIYLPIS